MAHKVWRFYIETGTRGNGPYRHHQCDTEDEVEAFLAEHPGWIVTERSQFKEWRRRRDLELRGANAR